MPLSFLGNVFYSSFTNSPLLEEHEYVATVSNMTETELTTNMKFEENNLFILFPNPTVAAKIIVSMTSSS